MLNNNFNALVLGLVRGGNIDCSQVVILFSFFIMQELIVFLLNCCGNLGNIL